MKLTERKLYDMAQQWPDFQAFVAATDQIAGREIVANAFKYMFSPLGLTKVKIKKDRLRELVDTFTMAMLREGYKAIVNKNSVDDLFARASRGELRQALLNRGNQHFPWLGVTETTQDQDIDIAVDWILGRSGTDKAKNADVDMMETNQEVIRRAREAATQRTIAGIRNAMANVIRNNRTNVCDITTLMYLQRHAGPVNARRRTFMTMGLENTFYGGTAMGGAVQRYVEEKVLQLSGQALANPAFWYDVSCLQLTGYIIAHGFVDANGRSARMMYACTQIQKGRRFIAPHKTWTNNQVDGRNVNQVINPGRAAVDRYTDELIAAMV